MAVKKTKNSKPAVNQAASKSETKEIVIRETPGKDIITADDVVRQMEMINDLYKRVMKKDEHFGRIPGTQKDTLYKAGAEKLNTMFKLVPKVEEEKITDSPDGHREVKYIVGLYRRGSEEFWGQGVGSCSTMESKYRYRFVFTELKPTREEADSLKSQGLGKWKNVDAKWVWMAKVDNQDIADQYNTIMKMAFKRALVAATINATGVSDIFTQDVEDMPEFERNEAPEAKTDKTPENRIYALTEAKELFKNAIDIKAVTYLKTEFAKQHWTKEDGETLYQEYLSAIERLKK